MSAPRLCILAGIRTPLGKMDGALRKLGADDLGALALRELTLRTGLDTSRLDAVVCGNVGQGPSAPNIARVIALRAGVSDDVEAMTVHRNCASGFEAVTQCAQRLRAGRGRMFVAVATESMTSYPLLFRPRAVAWFKRLQRSRSAWKRFTTLLGFRPSMMAPDVALLRGCVCV